jgi:hypothetical protein
MLLKPATSRPARDRLREELADLALQLLIERLEAGLRFLVRGRVIPGLAQAVDLRARIQAAVPDVELRECARAAQHKQGQRQ